MSAAAVEIGRRVAKGADKWVRALPSFQPKSNSKSIVIDEAHYKPMGTWSAEKIQLSRDENPHMQTWTPGSARHNLPVITHGEGPYLYDINGKQYLDWTSQAVCTNLGHDIPETVIQAATHQMRQLPFVYGGMGMTEVRARLNQLMGEILPGDLRAGVFPCTGAEANEVGITMARRFTGKRKVISWYRSYHGGTAHASAATGDSRRWFAADEVPGFVKAFNPFPLFFNHAGDTEQENVESALRMLEEQILNEGPDNIASIMTESIVGAGGVLVFPDGYLQGVRALCDKYGILMHIDEVMVGFGRTGKMFGFQNYDGVMPDIMTCAKGISSAAVPLSMMACTPEIMDYFEDNSVGIGSTYQAHPVSLACAYENLKYTLETDLVGHVEKLAPVFEYYMRQLAEDHPCIKQYRAIGIFGCFDVEETEGTNPKLQHVPTHEAFAKYAKAFNQNGLIGLHRFPHLHCAPPLNISEEDLIEGFNRLDKSLDTLDEAMGFTNKR